MPTKMSQKEIEARRRANATRKAAVEQQQAQKAQEKKETVQKAASALSQGAKNLRSAGPTAQNAPAKKTTKNHLLQGAIQQQRKGYTAKEVGQKLPSSVKNVIDRTYTAQRNANIKRAEEAMKRATDRRSKIAASHQLRQAKHTLSLADKQLSQDDQNKILRAREQWEQGESLKRRGDTQRGNALQEAAHYAAETARAGGGYSGGESGQDYLLPEIGEGYQQLMTEEGKRTLRTAKLYYRLGQQGGSRELMDAAHELANAARGNTANYSRAALERQWANIPTAQRYDGNDRPVYTPSLLEARAQESFLPAVADQTAGSLLSLLETARTSTRNMARNSGNQKYQNAKTSYERLSRQAAQATDPEEKARLERAATQAKKVMEENKADDAVDPNSKGQELLRKAAQESENVLAGMQSKGGKLLAQAALSMANMAPSLLLSAVATPAAGLALMGAQAAGSKAGELGARGVSAQEALARGLVSGGIEGITEKIPLGNLMEIVKRGGGASFLKTIAKQAGIEATEESASYALNWAADKAVKDPEAKFSLAELAENAAVGAISGGGFGGLGSLAARVNHPTQGSGPLSRQEGQLLWTLDRRQQEQTVQAEPTQTAPIAEQGERPTAQTKATAQKDIRQSVQLPKQTAAELGRPEAGGGRQAAGKTLAPAASIKRATAPVFSGALRLKRAGQTLGESGRKALGAAYDGRGDQAAYFQGFAQVYNQALTGRAPGEIPAPRGLTDAQVLAAYSAGQNDRVLSLAQAKEKVSYATVQGKDAGLVYDDYVSGVLDKGTAREINTVAKQLGLRVELVDAVAGGAANAEIQDGVVRLEKGNPNPVRALFGHELTHRVQELAPESYREFRDYVMGLDGYQDVVQEKIASYAARGVALAQEAAMDEIAADYAGDMIEDRGLLEEFIQKNKADQSLLRRFLEAMKDLAAKLTGRYQAQARDAAALLEKAVGDAARQAGKLGAKKNTARGGGVRYSIDGTRSNDIVKKVNQNREALEEKGVLKTLTGEEFSKGEKSLVQQVGEYFNQLGGQIERKGFGVVRLSRRGIKDSVAHGIGRKKAAAFAAVPEVIQNGAQIDYQKDWKGRGYDTYIFAGDVMIGGEPNAVGVVVIQRNGDNRFYLHEVAAMQKSGTATFKTGGIENDRLPGDAVPTSTFIINEAEEKSKRNIQQEGKVKKKFSLKEPVEEQAGGREIQAILQKVRKGNESRFGNPSEGEADIRAILADASQGKGTVDAIVKVFSKEGYKISTQTAKDIQALFKAGYDATRFSLKGADGYHGLIEKYGVIEAGENPRARDVQVPKQTADNKKVSRTVRTVMEAAATPDGMVPTIQDMVAKGDFSYEVAGDKEAIETAEATIRDKGFQASLMDWTSALAAGKVSKQNVADGWALYNAAAQAGDTKTAADILTRIVQHQRNAAQAVQATRILKKMSPGAQLYGIQRSVQNMQAELKNKYGDKAPNLEIPDKLVEKYLNAETEETREEAEKEIYAAIGKQMPSTFLDKWNAWRYLAMLGNVRTHVRNVVGNLGFAPVVFTKDLVGTVAEGIGSAVSGGKMQKTKGLYGAELFKAAWGDYKNAVDQIMAGGKYNDLAMKNAAIEEGRVIFKNKLLESLRKFNSNALEKEDSWFAVPHYANALAQYCAANKITAEQLMTGEGIERAELDKARGYAVKEAQKATYRDTNSFSDFISSVGRYNGDNAVKKAFSHMVEGVLPFRKTPANILVRAVEYSPIGLADGIWELTYGVKSGRNTAAEALDRMSEGLTGTGLFALGLYLAAQGILIASGDDDDKQKAYDDLLGKQEYAIQLPNGTSITIDWLAPECIPMFMGAEYWNAMAERDETGEFDITQLLDALSKVTNPMLEMSCLSSLNDLFDNLSGYRQGDVSSLVTVVAGMALSYLTQGIPTLLGQGERSSQEERMTTYTDKNKNLPADWQYQLGKISGRIPKWDYNQIPYIDAWGRTENEGSVLERVLNNFMNPAYLSKYAVSSMEAELQRLYDVTGETVLPERAEKKLTINGEEIDLTADQYVQYATLKGKGAQALLQELTSAAWYAGLGDGEKAEMAANAQTIAKEKAKLALFPEYESKNSVFRKAVEMEAQGVPISTYLMLNSVAGAVEGAKTADGISISDSASYNKYMALKQAGVMDSLDEAQREAAYKALGIGARVSSMSDDALTGLGKEIEEKENAPSVYNLLGEDKSAFVKEFYDTASQFRTSYDKNGNEIKGQEKQDKIIAEIAGYSNLSRSEKSALYHMFYESDKNNPWA